MNFFAHLVNETQRSHPLNCLAHRKMGTSVIEIKPNFRPTCCCCCCCCCCFFFFFFKIDWLLKYCQLQRTKQREIDFFGRRKALPSSPIFINWTPNFNYFFFTSEWSGYSMLIAIQGVLTPEIENKKVHCTLKGLKNKLPEL